MFGSTFVVLSAVFVSVVCGVPTICNDVEHIVQLIRPGSTTTAADEKAAQIATSLGVPPPTPGAGPDRWLPIQAIQQHVNSQINGFVNPRRAMFACTEGIEKSVDDSMYDTGDVLTVLGGDLAEYLLAVNVYRHHFNGTRGDTMESAISLFADYLKSTPASRTFYFHSTPAAVRAMYMKYGLDINEDLRDPFGLEVPQEYNKPKILAGVVDPQFVGCQHLKQILLHPDEYRTPLHLTEKVIQSAFLYLWGGNRLSDSHRRDIQFELVDGDYRGSAVLMVQNNVTNGKCSVGEHFYPLIAPRLNWSPHELELQHSSGLAKPHKVPYQLYVEYPQSAVHRRRHNMAAFFVEQPMGLPTHPIHPLPGKKGSAKATPIPLNIFHQHMDKLAREQHARTMEVLTKGLPVYQVTLIPKVGVDADDTDATSGAGSTGFLRYASISVLVLLAAAAIALVVLVRRSPTAGGASREEELPLLQSGGGAAPSAGASATGASAVAVVNVAHC